MTRKSRQTPVGSEDPPVAFTLDAFGSAAIDLLGSAMCQRVDEQATAEGLRTTVPLSPGPVGWPVASGQHQIFSLLDSTRPRRVSD